MTGLPRGLAAIGEGSNMADNEFLKNKNQIRRFCHRATHSGGVLVAGIRGVGKTHLVDAALNERNEQGTSRRVQVIREPKKLPRYLIKVDVDPFFPTDEKTTKSDTTVDENALAFILMRNIVFGLTSAIDSRYSLRQHGKTLRERLGFWRYWFAPNGIIPDCIYLISALFAFSLFIFLWVGRLLEHYLNGLTFLSGHVLACFTHPFGFLSILFGSGVVAVMLLMFWRWLDWRALANMSAYLFALVNAHETSKTDDKETSIKQELTSKLPVFLLPVLIVLLIYCTVKGSFKDITDLIEMHKELTGLLLAIVAYTAVKISETKNHDHTHYDQTNSAWMISLLRRYLFLCHRCGLEPVLVLDELDKLEELNDFWQESRQNQAKEKSATPKKTSTPRFTKSTAQMAATSPQDNKLDMFLVALARLKSSLGAEFLWVLISGPKLGERLKKHRHKRIDGNLGILATVITQEVIVGAMDAGTAKQIAEDKLTQQQSIEVQTEPEDETTQFKENGSWLKEEGVADVLWLRSYGNPATMVRMVESKEFFTLKPSDKVSSLAAAVKDLWRTEQQVRYFEFNSELGYQEFLFDKWSQVWIHSGMLNLANRFIKEAVPYDYFNDERLDKELKKFYETLNGVEPYEYFTDEYLDKAFKDFFNWDVNRSRIDREVLALLSGNPTLLQMVGEKMLFRCLLNKGGIIAAGEQDAGIYVRFVSTSQSIP